MKYVVFKIDGEEAIFLFPRTLRHDRFAEAVTAFKVGDQHWRRPLRGEVPVAAGFVTQGQCHGKSETLGIGSRGAVDTGLLERAGI